MFGPASIWQEDVSDAPVADDSNQIVDALAEQVADHSGGVASLNVWKYGASIVTVAADQPRVDVAFDDCQHKGYTPRGLTGADGQFAGVPLPPDAAPAAGSDSSLALWSPDTHELWEFWKLKHDSSGWSACWGGHIPDTTTSAGYFDGGFGTTATGLAGSAGAVHIDDVRDGRIDHAIAFAVVDAASWKTFSWPAQRSDGWSGSSSPVMEGQRFKLPESVDVDVLPMSPIGKMVARAAQTYGMVVTDKSGVVAIGAESGKEQAALTGRDPWTGLLGEAKSYSVLHDFPWDQLQALPRDYGEPGQ